jgi:hypothetical protein
MEGSRMRKVVIALILAILTLPVQAAQKSEPVSPFSMQLHSMEGSVEGHQATIDLCKQAGVKMVRDEIHWDRVEREKGVFKIDDNIM